MATKIIPQGTLDDIDALSIEAKGLAHLSLWINEARGLIDKLRLCAGAYPEVASALHECDLRYLSPEWDGDQVDGMDYLCLRQAAIAAEIAEASSAVRKGARHG